MTQAKELIFDDEVRHKLHEGVSRLGEVAGITLGPRGRHVGVETKGSTPFITSDGYTIVKDIEFKDQFVNMGAALAKEAAARMKELCGDGTTSTLILLKAMVEQGIKNIGGGASPILLKRGMEKGVEAVVKELEKSATPIHSLEKIIPLAISSAAGHTEIGHLIGRALEKVGPAGIVTIEEGKTVDTTLEMIEGIQFERGYLSSYFCTNIDRRTAVLHDAAVLITDQNIQSIQEIIHLLHVTASSGKELLIIADGMQADALSALVMNQLKGILKVCVVQAPSFGEERHTLLQDLACLTGATLVSQEMGMSLKDSAADVLGFLQKAVVTKDTTTVIGGAEDKVEIQERIKAIDAQIKNEKPPSQKEKLLQRKAQLLKGIAVIHVGGATEFEMRQKKQLFEDSLNATQAALEAGFVPGGGTALMHVARQIGTLGLKEDELLGMQIILKACDAPFRQIVQNSNLEASVLIDQMLSHPIGWGFNAISSQLENLIESGVVDALKIVKNSLITALSTAATILLSEVMIGHSKEA